MTETEFSRVFRPLRDRAQKDPAFDAKVRELITLCAADVRIAAITGKPSTTRAELLSRLNALLAEVGAPPVPP
jgi:hypothetical protein